MQLWAHPNIHTFFRLECGQEERISQIYGPFPFIQLTCNMLRIGPDGEVVTELVDDEWRMLTGDDKNWYSDVIIWAAAAQTKRLNHLDGAWWRKGSIPILLGY